MSASVHALLCDKVVLTGYQNWPPYSFEKEGALVGVGVDVASQIFQQLDIPVEVQTYEKPSKMSLILKQGQADLLVATYDTPEWRESVDLIEPAYFEDAIAILVPVDQPFVFGRWYDLMGRTGATVNQTQLGGKFTDFATRYLSIQSEPSIESALALLDKHEAEYVVGGVAFLRSHLAKLGRQDQFKLLPNLVAPQKVYLAFSKESSCRTYLPFVQTQLEQMQKEGRLDKLLQKYSLQ